MNNLIYRLKYLINKFQVYLPITNTTISTFYHKSKKFQKVLRDRRIRLELPQREFDF